MTPRATLCYALALLVATAMAEGVLELDTQHGQTVTVLGDGVPRVVVYADRDGAAQTAAWAETLESSACPAIAVANLSTVPDFARSMVSESFRDDDPIALDWEGAVADRLGFTPGEANVYLVNGAGTVLAHLHGPATKARRERLRLHSSDACATTS